MFRAQPKPPPPPFAPLPERLPVLKRVVLKIWAESAVQNKLRPVDSFFDSRSVNILLSAIMSLQCITGVRADPLFAETADNAKRIRAGMPLGARVEISGPRMFEFVDKLTQCVLPRIREFKGINPIGDDNGAIQFTLPDTAIGYFPDIEPHFDMFPRLFNTDITMYTSGKSDAETILCLSGFQIPFLEQRETAKEAVDDSQSIWEKVRNAKTREE
eukprot:jgi/Hompol1/5535/HPOL_002006-RA